MCSFVVDLLAVPDLSTSIDGGGGAADSGTIDAGLVDASARDGAPHDGAGSAHDSATDK